MQKREKQRMGALTPGRGPMFLYNSLFQLLVMFSRKEVYRLSVYLYLHLSIYLSTCPSNHLSIQPYTYNFQLNLQPTNMLRFAKL